MLIVLWLYAQEEQQAYARLHRYGQQNEVDAIVYYTPVSVESRLLEWRKRSDQNRPDDENVEFRTIDGINSDSEQDSEEEEDDDEFEPNDESDEDDLDEKSFVDETKEMENQTKFLLNL